jgi:hypothetical protein
MFGSLSILTSCPIYRDHYSIYKMDKLSDRDIELVNVCIQQVYTLCTLAEFPQRVMTLLESLIGSKVFI